MDRTDINPLFDRLHASLGIGGKTYLVLNDEYAIALPEGKTPSEALAWVWRYGSVDLSKWSGAESKAPQYVHDCEDCTFLGRVSGLNRQGDAWLDTHSGRNVLIVRYSSEGADYSAMEAHYYANAGGIRGEAYRLAAESGLLDDSGDPDWKCPDCDRRMCRCGGGWR